MKSFTVSEEEGTLLCHSWSEILLGHLPLPVVVENGSDVGQRLAWCHPLRARAAEIASSTPSREATAPLDESLPGFPCAPTWCGRGDLLVTPPPPVTPSPQTSDFSQNLSTIMRLVGCGKSVLVTCVTVVRRALSRASSDVHLAHT